jgi:hypothetical protein
MKTQKEVAVILETTVIFPFHRVSNTYQNIKAQWYAERLYSQQVESYVETIIAGSFKWPSVD